jgi:nitrogen fixation NifU-like protein
MKSYYSKEALEHFLNPKNMGVIENPDAIGKVGNPICGDQMEIYIKVEKKDGQEIIKDIKFKTLGCAAAIATSDMICELAKGKTLEEAVGIKYQDIVNGLGDLPPVKIHCSFLANNGLKEAVKDYHERNGKK